MTKADVTKMKAWFAVNFLPDVTGDGGCETCGYGGDEAMSLGAILKRFDAFVEEESLS